MSSKASLRALPVETCAAQRVCRKNDKKRLPNHHKPFGLGTATDEQDGANQAEDRCSRRSHSHDHHSHILNPASSQAFEKQTANPGADVHVSSLSNDTHSESAHSFLVVRQYLS